MTSKLLRTYCRVAASEPTSSLSMTIDTFYPFTLDQYFGTLTVVWVVPLSEPKFTPGTFFLRSTKLTHLELDSGATPFEAYILNPYLYSPSILPQDLTAANFGRNQLSPGSIGFLPLFTG